MINLSQNIKPLILVQTPHINTYEIKDLIHDYMVDNAVPCHCDGKIEPVLDVLHEHETHSENLFNYFKKHITDPELYRLVSGYFYSENIGSHRWIQAGDLIVDIAISRFNHYPAISEDIWNMFANYSYLLSDSIDHPLHQLYVEL